MSMPQKTLASAGALACALFLSACDAGSSDGSSGAGAGDGGVGAGTLPSIEVPKPPTTSDALVEYVSGHESELDAARTTYADYYSDIQLNAIQPSTVEYAYVYSDTFDTTDAAAQLDTQVEALQQVCDTSLFPDMKANGIVPPVVRYTYYAADGSLLWSHDFTPSA